MEENEQVILVSAGDEAIGTAGKMDVHRTGQLHRAFSVFIKDEGGRILLQRRAEGKYHSAGLWSNACCGHPRPDETTQAAAERRLSEELGIECDLTRAGSFTYRASLGNGLTEHEIDHVFTGVFSGEPHPNSDEVQETRWISPDDLRSWIARDRDVFTAWFVEALSAVTSDIESRRSP